MKYCERERKGTEGGGTARFGWFIQSNAKTKYQFLFYVFKTGVGSGTGCSTWSCESLPLPSKPLRS